MCALEFPELQKQIANRYAGRVVVAGVNPGRLMMGGESHAQVQSFIDQTRVSFPVGFDNGETYKHYEYGGAISPFPLDVIVAPDGTIAYAKRRYDLAEMLSVIDEIAPPQ